MSSMSEQMLYESQQRASSIEEMSESFEMSSRDMPVSMGPLYEPVVRMPPESGSKFTPISNS